MNQVWGDVSSLRNTVINELEELYTYKVPIGLIISHELIEILNYLTIKIGKEIAVYIDRKGNVKYVAVGSNQQVTIPEMWIKRKEGGLNGLRCIHTHPNGNSNLSSADLSALNNLKLDMIVALGGDEKGIRCSLAYLQPTKGELTGNFTLLSELDIATLLKIPFLELIKNIEKELIYTGYAVGQKDQEEVILVLVEIQDKVETNEMEEAINELTSLAETAGLKVSGVVTQRRIKPDNSFFIGKGKIEEIRLLIQQKKPDCIIFNNSLSPAQQNNLSEFLGIKVLDRTDLILDIFAQRARSREGKLQVELAQLNYLLPRLIGQGTILSRLGGGVGTRGPGETKLETDRRHIRKRINYLKEQLAEVKKNRAIQTKNRNKNAVPQIALVGYTNAGKSSLLNTLADENILAEDKLFATLDPTTRSITLEEGIRVLVTDTVGFIKDLPHQLIEAFKATLEEAKASDLLLHIIDISNPNWENQKNSVNKVLEQLEITDKPIILVYNKVDLLQETPIIPPDRQKNCFISTKTGEGIEQLKNLIKDHFFGQNKVLKFFIPFDKGNILDKLYNSGKVLEVVNDYQGYNVIVEINEKNFVEEFKKYIIME